MKLEVGEYYLSSNGEIIKVEYSDTVYYHDLDGNYYEYNGYFVGDMREFDLIAHIPKQLLNHLIVEINNYHTDSDFRKVVDSVYGE